MIGCILESLIRLDQQQINSRSQGTLEEQMDCGVQWVDKVFRRQTEYWPGQRVKEQEEHGAIFSKTPIAVLLT